MKRFVAIIFVLAFMFVFMSGSFAETKGETPHVHYYHLAETVDHGQSGFCYYSVNLLASGENDQFQSDGMCHS